MKKKPPYNQNAAIRGALRRAFARSPLVQEKMMESRREVAKYNKDGSLAKKPAVQRQCEVCNNWVGSTKITIDHITPVVSVTIGFQDWNEFIDRLWCNKSNLQRICDPCHDAKTYKEKIDRLTEKYTRELDGVELTIQAVENGNICLKDTVRGYVKSLNKYISKKKTSGLETISNRAFALKERAKKYK